MNGQQGYLMEGRRSTGARVSWKAPVADVNALYLPAHLVGATFDSGSIVVLGRVSYIAPNAVDTSALNNDGLWRTDSSGDIVFTPVTDTPITASGSDVVFGVSSSGEYQFSSADTPN